MDKNWRMEGSSVEIINRGGNCQKFTAESSEVFVMMILIIVVISVNFYTLRTHLILRRMQRGIINTISCRITPKEICLDMNYRRP